MANNSQPLDYEEEERLMPARIIEVKAVLKDKHGLDVPYECDKFIARCIRSKDGDLEKAIKLIIALHETIVDFQDWDATLQPTVYKEFYNSSVVSTLVQRDRQGRSILCFRLGMWNPEIVNFDQLLISTWMATQHLIKESTDVQRHGFAIIYDCSNFTLKQAWAVKHWRLLAPARWAQNGVAGRQKVIHVIFHSKVVKAIYKVVKPFLQDKMKKRLFFHQSLDCLHEHIEPKGLPKYLGGELEPRSEEWVDMNFMKGLLLQDAYFKDSAVTTFPSK